MMDIKEIALRISEKADEYADAKLQSKGEFHPDWHTVRDEYFAEALVAELAKVNKPVGYVDYGDRIEWYGTKPLPETDLYTLPPTASQIEQETAEAIAAYLTSGRYMVLNPGVLISAEQHTQYLKNHDIYQANAIRRGAWKEFKK